MKRPEVEHHLETRLWNTTPVEDLCRWIIHLEAENARLRKGFGEAIRRPMGVVPAGYEDIVQEDGKR